MKIISSVDINNSGLDPVQSVEWVREAFLLKERCQLPPKISTIFHNYPSWLNFHFNENVLYLSIITILYLNISLLCRDNFVACFKVEIDYLIAFPFYHTEHIFRIVLNVLKGYLWIESHIKACVFASLFAQLLVKAYYSTVELVNLNSVVDVGCNKMIAPLWRFAIIFSTSIPRLL